MNMTKVKTSELEGAALDWAVALTGQAPIIITCWCGEYDLEIPGSEDENGVVDLYSPSTDWAQGGPLISEYLVTVGSDSGNNRLVYWAYAGLVEDDHPCHEGATHLIAACRAIVASKLGDVVSVPSELLEQTK